MEIKTAEAILDKHLFNRFDETDKTTFKNAIHEYATQAVRMALQEAAEKATMDSGGHGNDYWIDKDSILSLESEIISRLK